LDQDRSSREYSPDEHRNTDEQRNADDGQYDPNCSGVRHVKPLHFLSHHHASAMTRAAPKQTAVASHNTITNPLPLPLRRFPNHLWRHAVAAAVAPAGTLAPFGLTPQSFATAANYLDPLRFLVGDILATFEKLLITVIQKAPVAKGFSNGPVDHLRTGCQCLAGGGRQPNSHHRRDAA
jgi:hypothetical protein